MRRGHGVVLLGFEQVHPVMQIANVAVRFTLLLMGQYGAYLGRKGLLR